jgi:hypothetical protein
VTASTLYDPAKHEPLADIAWDETRARAMIDRIVRETEARFSPDTYWPVHARDRHPGESEMPRSPLYMGACGVVWALQYLEATGAVRLERSYSGYMPGLLASNDAWLASFGGRERSSYLMGNTPILLLSYGADPSEDTAAALQRLISSNIDNPFRELMWGSPGTMLAALFLHERSGEARWADLFRETSRKLWTQLHWSKEYQCHYWKQDVLGKEGSCLDAVHGFVATASPLIRGRHLLEPKEWSDWKQCIDNTIQRSATREGALASWRVHLYSEGPPRMQMQFCHGAPGFVICLADMPGRSLDELLIAAGEATWAAGPLKKGANLCHGTGGNGYAFLKLHGRTQDAMWLDRARAFAMHGIQQVESDALRFGQLHYSLWTGDPGFAIYLLNCIRGTAVFPTLDAFFPDAPTQ